MTNRRMTPEQLATLEKQKKKADWAVFGKSFYFPGILLIFSLIPTKYLAFLKIFSRRGRNATLDDASLMQDLGPLYVLGGILAFYLLFVVVFAITYRYFGLRKDLQEQEVLHLEGKVKNLKVINDYGTKYYDLYFSPSHQGRSRVRYYEAHPFFYILSKGQKVTLIVSKSAFFPLSLIPGEMPSKNQ